MEKKPESPAPAPAPAAPAANQVVDVGAAFLPPAGIIKAIETAGVAKGNLSILKQFLLGFLAGVFISIGGAIGVIIGKGMPGNYVGLQKFAFGAVFPIGLVLVIICGSELFTGNAAALVAGWLNGKIKWWQIINNWFFVYWGNFVGSLFVAYFWVYLTDLYAADPWLDGIQAIAQVKTSQGFGVMFLSGMGCNFLVCLAVFMATAAKTLTCKVLVIWFPIQTFVTIGWEHCVANMFLVPAGIMYGANVSFGKFIYKNLIPVTLGNTVSAVFFVTCVYWYLYNLPAGWPIGSLIPKPKPKVIESTGSGLTPMIAPTDAVIVDITSPSSKAEQAGNAGNLPTLKV